MRAGGGAVVVRAGGGAVVVRAAGGGVVVRAGAGAGTDAGGVVELLLLCRCLQRGNAADYARGR